MSQRIDNKLFHEIRIGDKATLERTLTKRDIDMFAMMSGDMNPTHHSAQYARALLNRGKVVGHSMWGGSLISSLLGNDLPGPGTVYKSQSLSFHGALELGDALTITVTAKEKNSTDQTVVFDCLARNQRGDTIITGIAIVQPPTTKPVVDELMLEDLEYHSRSAFQELIEMCRDTPPIPTSVAHPCSRSALLGAVDAAAANIIAPVLVGPEHKIRQLADTHEIDLSLCEIVDVPHSHRAAEEAVAMCRSGRTEAIMKGSLHTHEILAAALHRDKGIRTENRFSHVFIMDVPTYPRPLLVTDAAVNIYPALVEKVDIVKNAIQLAHNLGNETPKVAILSAMETINPKIPSTLEAAALCKMADRGQITGAIIDGPLAFDNAISREAANIKGIESPVSGEADILVTPDLEAGNMLAKQLTYLANADAAGIVMGARVPIILTSRADTAKARLTSCAVAAAVAYAKRSQPAHV